MISDKHFVEFYDDGVDLSIDQGVLVVRQEGDAATVKVMCYLADVLALAHHRGLL